MLTSVPDALFREEAQNIAQAIRKRQLDEKLQGYLDAISAEAAKQGMPDTMIPVADVFTTCICFVGSKSLSHVLSCIERCKERLLDIGRASDAARKQIITSVMAYWQDQPGIGVNIIDKLLNYTILTPMSVVEWALREHSDGGAALARHYIYEMVSMTVFKVTNRVRQIVGARLQRDLPPDQAPALDETLETERARQAALFAAIEDALVGFATATVGSKEDEIMDDAGEENAGGDDRRLLRDWGARWLRVFRRRAAVEEAFVAGELAELEKRQQQQQQQKSNMASPPPSPQAEAQPAESEWPAPEEDVKAEDNAGGEADGINGTS
jgi:nuclear cap-binding protein subunit 1